MSSLFPLENSSDWSRRLVYMYSIWLSKKRCSTPSAQTCLYDVIAVAGQFIRNQGFANSKRTCVPLKLPFAQLLGSICVYHHGQLLSLARCACLWHRSRRDERGPFDLAALHLCCSGSKLDLESRQPCRDSNHEAATYRSLLFPCYRAHPQFFCQESQYSLARLDISLDALVLKVTLLPHR